MEEVDMSSYYDLGDYSRRVSTTSTEAQRWFDRGLIWTYGYNHEEALRCFAKAADADPNCAMAQWGIAYAAGPNYNKQWAAFDTRDLRNSLEMARDATQRALALIGSATPVEQALIRPLAKRYPSSDPQSVTSMWNDDYADAMREVYLGFPRDHDIAALFAEAIMNRTPWLLWDIKTGEPAAGANTEEAIAVLEAAMAGPEGMQHPGILHMYIHLMEMSPYPERALKAADALRRLVPDAGHLVHMPTHIDVLCGNYRDVIEWNTKACAADERFLAQAGSLNFYTLYRCHNYHFRIYGAMFSGQYGEALAAAYELEASLSSKLLRVESPAMADLLEAFVGMRMHVYVRFGKWQEIVSEPLPEDQDIYCVTIALIHYAKAIAFANLYNATAAKEQVLLFEQAVKRIPASRSLFNNTAVDILAVAAETMRGEVEYYRFNYDKAFGHLRNAVRLYDDMPYDEPWGFMQPIRHALGALLLEQNQVSEAEAVYRADLGYGGSLSRPCQHLDNVWSLHGLHECLVKLNRQEEAAIVKQRLDLASARADVPIKASCFCRQM